MYVVHSYLKILFFMRDLFDLGWEFQLIRFVLLEYFMRVIKLYNFKNFFVNSKYIFHLHHIFLFSIFILK